MGWLGKAWRVMQTHITRHVFPSHPQNKPPSGREVAPVLALVTEGESPGSLKRSGQKVQRNRGWRLWVEALAVDQRSLPQSACG